MSPAPAILVLEPLLQALIAGLASVMIAVVPLFTIWLKRLLAKKLELETDLVTNAVGDRLDKAAYHAIDYARVELADRLRASNPHPTQLLPEIVESALGYLRRHVPDAIRRVDLGEEALRELIMARVPDRDLTPP